MYSLSLGVVAGACIFVCIILSTIARQLERIAEALEKDGKIK